MTASTILVLLAILQPSRGDGGGKPPVAPPAFIFSDNFESGSTSAWSAAVGEAQGPCTHPALCEPCVVVNRPYSEFPELPTWACFNLPRCTETRWLENGHVSVTHKTLPGGRWREEVCDE